MQRMNKKIMVEGEAQSQKSPSRNNVSGNSKISFDSDVMSIVESLRKKFNPCHNISLQVLTAKEIEKGLNKMFSKFVFNVSEVDSETSKRMVAKFTDPKYWYYTKEENERAILNDILSCETLICKDDIVMEPKKKTKIMLKSKVDSRMFSTQKEYIFDGKIKAVKIMIKSKDKKNLIGRSIFSIPGIYIDDELCRDKLFKRMTIGGKIKSLPEYKNVDLSEDGLYKALDFNFILSFCRLIEETFNYIDEDTSFLYNANNTYYNKVYSVEDMYNLLNVSFLGEKESAASKDMAELIVESAIAVTNNQVNLSLNTIHNRESNIFFKRISCSTEDKLPKYKAIERNNRFISYFDSVEVDNNIDTTKFFEIENEFVKLNESLQLKTPLSEKANLVFKDNGQQDFDFIYESKKKKIYININKPNTLCIGLANYLDYNLSNKQTLSMETEFKVVAFQYRNCLEDTANSDDTSLNSLSVYKSKKNIFHSPTEIWARCFEIYLHIGNNIRGNIIHSKEHMTICNGYPKINEDLLNRIINYFNNIFEVTPCIDTSNMATSFPNTNNSFSIGEEGRAAQEAAVTSIDIADKGLGSNYFFKIIEEALNSSNQEVKIKKRRKKVVNFTDRVTQMTFF